MASKLRIKVGEKFEVPVIRKFFALEDIPIFFWYLKKQHMFVCKKAAVVEVSIIPFTKPKQ